MKKLSKKQNNILLIYFCGNFKYKNVYWENVNGIIK